MAQQQKLVTYKQLHSTQRCIYQAFSQLSKCKELGDTPERMAGWVNQQGYDADSENAVILLAGRYELKGKYGAMGDEMTGVESEAKEEAIFIISQSDKTADALAQKFGKGLAANVNKILLYLKDPKFHAIYGEANGKGKFDWIDEQGLRKRGPLKHDYFLYYSTK
eukprot:320149_1